MISTDVQQLITALEARGIALQQKTRRVALPAAISAILAGGAWMVARSLAPDALPDSIDIPLQLLSAFSEGSGGGGLAGSPFMSLNDSLMSVVSGPAVQVIGVLAIIVGGFTHVFDGSIRSLGRTLIAMGILLNAVTLSLTFTAPETTNTTSDRSNFEHLVQEHDYDGVKKTLDDAKIHTLESRYVLAQLVARLHQPTPVSFTPAPAWVKEVATALEQKPPFEPNPNAVYSIDMAAYGEPHSDIAKTYVGQAQHKSRIATVAAGTATAISIGSIALALVFAGIRLAISQRLNRIQTLLGIEKKSLADTMATKHSERQLT